MSFVSPEMKKYIHLDMDPGIDDILALIFALASPELHIAGITTVNGNVDAVTGANNVLKTLQIVNETRIPRLGAGSLSNKKNMLHAHEVHGTDGMGNINIPDPPNVQNVENDITVLCEVIQESQYPLHLISTGPLTNIGEFIRNNPSMAARYASHTFMGGTIHVPGNISPVAEFNIFMDPENARQSLLSILPKLMVGLDVTSKVILTPDRLLPELESMKHPGAPHFAQMIRYYMGFNQRMRGVNGCCLHDPLAIGAFIDESLVETVDLFVDVETVGTITMGMTVADLRQSSKQSPNCRVCIKVNAARFLEMFVTRILDYLRKQWNE